MGYNQNNTIKMIQIILQDCQRLDIQIVGRLIQDQYIRCTHQNTHQVQSSLFSPGKLLNL